MSGQCTATREIEAKKSHFANINAEIVQTRMPVFDELAAILAFALGECPMFLVRGLARGEIELILHVRRV